jgi:hypothetical protein
MSWQLPGARTAEPPTPVYASWTNFLERSGEAERTARCRAIAKRANRKRLLSQAPRVVLTPDDVWFVLARTEGRCIHCRSLAVENRPSDERGAPIAWAQIGRRIGSLDHLESRFDGGDNDASNLAWACLWCNTWPSERRPFALDHGGYYPPD